MFYNQFIWILIGAYENTKKNIVNKYRKQNPYFICHGTVCFSKESLICIHIKVKKKKTAGKIESEL